MLFNTARAESYMRECGVDALIATSPVNITYFTDYRCWIDPLFKEYMMVPGASSHLGQGYAVFPLEGSPGFVLNGSLMAANALDLPVEDLRVFGKPGLDHTLPPRLLPSREQAVYDLLHAPPRYATAIEALIGVLKDRGLTAGRLGLELEGLPDACAEDLRRALPGTEIRDATNLIRLIRMVKSKDELARLTRAADISEAAGRESLALARPGLPIAEIIRHFRMRLGELGADMDHFGYGVHGIGIATETAFTLTDETVEYVDWGCLFGGYFSDTGTTLALRPLSPALAPRFDALRACMDAAISAVRPGVTASDVHARMWEALEARGVTNLYPHGHGIGMEVRDYPIIVPDNGRRIQDGWIDVASDLQLEADMVINLEAPLFMPGVGSIHLEESLVVTPDGCRQLVPQARRGPVLPE